MISAIDADDVSITTPTTVNVVVLNRA